MRKRRGYTLIELVLGLAMSVMVSLALARMLYYLARTSQYTFQEISGLVAARQAYFNRGGYRGVLWALQEAQTVNNLSTTTLSLTLPGPQVIAFSTSAVGLIYDDGVTKSTQAFGVTDMFVTYYRMNNGTIAESTVAATAQYAQVTLTIKAKNKKQSDYLLTSGAWMRNH